MRLTRPRVESDNDPADIRRWLEPAFLEREWQLPPPAPVPSPKVDLPTPPARPSKISPESLPTEDRAPVVPAENVAAIQIVNGKSYASLEAACTEAVDAGSIIELRYNGLREPERPIRLVNKKVIIRAGDGYRPTIRFAVTDASAWTAISRT